MKKTCVLFLFVLFSAFAYSSSYLALALDSYARSDWKNAIEHLQQAINNAKNEEDIETALYYLVMSLASSGNYKNAVNSANMFLSRYPESIRHPDIVYQRGRLYCLLSLYEKSLKEFHYFVQKYPTHRAVPSAYYWIGENLYLSGKLKEGRDVFSRVLLNYPTSPKAELAKQRISLIDQVANQRELLTLLKLNQEETTNLVTEYEKKQQDFEKSLNNYKEMPRSNSNDSQLVELELTLQEEKAKNAELYEKLLVLEAKNKELLDALAMLDSLEEPQKEEEVAVEEEIQGEDIAESAEDDADAERARLAAEAAEKRRLVLEILKRKARQLEGMYDEILEEEKSDEK